MTQKEFEPKIVGFLCNWCSYAGADLAGTSRVQYPENVKAIRVMCSGRVDPTMVLKAFQEGADGVLVAGCHPGDCHYSQGNYIARRRFTVFKKMLEHFGIDSKRFRLEWVSASEGVEFGELVKKMTQDLRELGPLDLSKKESGD